MCQIKYRFLISSLILGKVVVLELELIKKLQAEDPLAFKELFRTYGDLVFNVCFRMLGNQLTAEDITQDVFLKVYKSIKQFRCESKLSTWLYRITINLCLNYRRRKKIEQLLSLDFVFMNPDEENNGLADTSKYEPDVILENQEIERIVLKAINSLPKQQCIALTLQFYEGLPYQEIADIMNCSVASVESRIFRAKQNLHKQLSTLIKDL